MAPRDAAAGLHHAAADRRRHHLARAHRAEDRPALQVADRLGEGRLARGRRGAVADQPGAARRLRAAADEADYADDPRAPPQPRRRQAAGVAGQGARAVASTCDWAATPRPRRSSRGCTCSTTTRWPSWWTASTGRRSSTPGSWPASYPAILDRRRGRARRRASCTATRARCCDKIVDEKWLTAKAVFGLWPANSVGDDVALHGRRRSQRWFRFLRQQADKPVERPNFCLADFIAPKDSGRQDWIGAFAVTAGLGIEPHLARFQRRPRRLQRDPAQGAGRPPGRSLRRTPAPARAQGVLGLRAGRGAGQRRADRRALPRHPPRPRLPGLPRTQREGDAVPTCSTPTGNTGIELTDSFAMYPAAAVSGLYFSHPDSQYFVVGRVSKEQVADYARRKGVDAGAGGALAGVQPGLRPGVSGNRGRESRSDSTFEVGLRAGHVLGKNRL